MTYEVRLRGSTVKDLRRLPPPQANSILTRVENLGRDPRPAASQELRGELRGLRRLRVGDYRVAYAVRDDAEVVEVWLIGHRRDLYERLRRQW
jgi:mRNA interferase RelE/StbE